MPWMSPRYPEPQLCVLPICPLLSSPSSFLSLRSSGSSAQSLSCLLVLPWRNSLPLHISNITNLSSLTSSGSSKLLSLLISYSHFHQELFQIYCPQTQCSIFPSSLSADLVSYLSEKLKKNHQYWAGKEFQLCPPLTHKFNNINTHPFCLLSEEASLFLLKTNSCNFSPYP